MLRSPMTMSASPLQQRREQLRDLVARVLVVGVGVDDEVGAALERGVDAGRERRRQPLVAAQPDDVIDAARARDVRRAVARPVVDDQDLDDVDAGDRSRQIGERRRQRLRLVEARDLDDQFHRTPSQLWRILRPYLAISRTSFSITPSQVMRRARRTRRRPSRPRARRSPASPLIAAASASGVRRADEPVDAVDDELVRAARVGARDDRLAREKRLERDVAEVLVVRRIEHRQRAGVELDQLVVVDAAEERRPGPRRRPRAAARSTLARCVPSPATTSRIGRSTSRHRRHQQIHPLDRFDAADRQDVVAVGPGTSAAARAAADGRALRPAGR